ncbi:urea transporter [Rodentibacter trehalosifermentans]|uniref:Urea transporter n=1 Tax=Rodentibacter trehalosifermentans TaxID=1908263 RepID=A0A1V3IVI2_9PAST|nr:urea transporter [Rodentibacter trehalosifermentans]OOF46082.1 urea transporter [Rodentibacter trehalosifermentans]OOF53084.1 urea transporter [Rodentibacter trehalosifermentans]
MQFIKVALVGIGQIFLQENGLSGLIICIAMFFSHWALGIGCLLGSIIGTLTAIKLNYPKEEIKQGLYGFNASLAFMCTMFTFGLNGVSFLIFLLGVISSVVSTLIMREFTKRNWVAYTFPFVLTCWIFCWGVSQIGLFGLSQTTPPLVDHTGTLESIKQPFYAWAEVNFGASLVTGLLLFIAIALSSPIAALWGMTASIISSFIADCLFDIEPNQLANGIYSFSAILVACAFAGRRLRDFVYITIGIILAIFIQFGVAKIGLPPYTIGFIVAAWLVRWTKSKIDHRKVSLKKFSHLFNP